MIEAEGEKIVEWVDEGKVEEVLRSHSANQEFETSNIIINDSNTCIKVE